MTMESKEIVKQLTIKYPNGLYGVTIGINDVNDQSKELINMLWDTPAKFVVTTMNAAIADMFNTAMINRSNSLDRWKMTPYGEFFNEQLQVLLEYKDISNEQKLQLQPKFIFTANGSKTSAEYTHIGSDEKDTTAKEETQSETKGPTTKSVGRPKSTAKSAASK